MAPAYQTDMLVKPMWRMAKMRKDESKMPRAVRKEEKKSLILKKEILS